MTSFGRRPKKRTSCDAPLAGRSMHQPQELQEKGAGMGKNSLGRRQKMSGCCRGFIPPTILDHLVVAAPVETRTAVVNSVRQSLMTREDRAGQRVGMEGLIAAGRFASGGFANRIVYDCENKWEPQLLKMRTEGGPATGDDSADNAYKYAGEARDFFADELGRNSIDNQGMELILNVHFGTDFMNAVWDGTQMIFGEGDGEIFSGFARSLDVVAHELAHGVTQHTANLEYANQPGALNEHFSDVFGTAITQHCLGQDSGRADWLIGNEIMGPTLYGEALRCMKAPGTAYDNPLLGKDPQPSHMRDAYTGPDDNGGVHINSGIPNKSFYLVAMEIGTTAAVKVWYHALQNLWHTAQFNDTVQVIVESSRILTKNKQTPLGTPQTVRSAFKEVGLPS